MREEYCVNCHLCEIHCLVAHSASGEIIHAYKEETPRPLPRIFVEERRPGSAAVRQAICLLIHSMQEQCD